MTSFLPVTFLIIMAAISPGPDFAMVTKNALSYSRRAGVYCALGVALGTLFHATYCIMGFSIIIAESPLLFYIIQYIGAAYLIYIGVRALFSKYSAVEPTLNQNMPTMTSKNAFLQGFFCNALNPKCVFFFLAFFTLIIKPSMSLWVKMAYGFEIGLIHFLWFALLSVFVTHKKIKHILDDIQIYVVKIMGGLLVGFGLRIALMAH